MELCQLWAQLHFIMKIFVADLSHPTIKNGITRCFTTCYVVISCGGRTRTCDLQVMSLASYQLLHSAILTQKTYSDL